MRIEFINSEAAVPVHGIFETSAMGVSRTLPALNEIVRSVVAPTIVVNFFQSAFTSVSMTPAIVAGLLRAVAAPFQVTATTSITRSSTAYAGVNPTVAMATAVMVGGADSVKWFGQPELQGYRVFGVNRHEDTAWEI